MSEAQPSAPTSAIAQELEIERRAHAVLAIAYRGIHHVDGWSRRRVQAIGVGALCEVTVYAGDLATFDFDVLTRLVVAAHDQCTRLSLRQAGPRHLKLMFHLRQREGRIYERHPTIEEAIASVRGSTAS